VFAEEGGEPGEGQLGAVEVRDRGRDYQGWSLISKRWRRGRGRGRAIGGEVWRVCRVRGGRRGRARGRGRVCLYYSCLGGNGIIENDYFVCIAIFQ